jgi:nitrous oxide reductase accessory protein NosL
MCEHHDRGTSVSRRAVVSAAGVACAGSIAGCLGSGGGDAPAAVSLTGDRQCDACGMVIEQHPGPVAQIFYRDHAPEGHDNPAWFCSAWEAFEYDFDRRDRGWEASARYVTDYSAVDYEVYEEGGETFVTAHLEPEAFGVAADLRYVVGSDVKGSMGKDLIPFSDADDAEAFAAEYGGETVAYGDVTPELVAQVGR